VLREASRRAGDAVASRVPPACQGRVREAVAAAHARCGAEVCVACAAPRMAEAQRLSVAPDAAVGDDGAPERAARRRPPPRRAAVAATRAVQAGSDGESSEEGCEADGGGDDAGGDGQRVGDSPDVREALWRSRCALAAATTRDTAVAFPGVERCPAAEVRRRSPQRHPFSQGASLLRGHVFRAGGRRWCVEEVTVVDAAGRLGVYAFDADTHTEATQLLTERCAVFGADWIGRLREQQQAARAEAGRQAAAARAGEVGASSTDRPTSGAPGVAPLPRGGSTGPQQGAAGGAATAARAAAARVASLQQRMAERRVAEARRVEEQAARTGAEAERRATLSPPPVAPPSMGQRVIVHNRHHAQAWQPLPGFTDVGVDRQSPLGNPYKMGADGLDETYRDAVCDAYGMLLDPLPGDCFGVADIANGRGLRVAGRFLRDDAAEQRASEMRRLERLLGRGERLRLLCWCAPRRCHGHIVAELLLGGGDGMGGGSRGGGGDGGGSSSEAVSKAVVGELAAGSEPPAKKKKKSPAAKRSGGKLRRLTHNQQEDARRRGANGDDGGMSGGHGGLSLGQ